MAADKTVNISFRGTEEFRDRLKREAIERKTNGVQEMIERAIESYLTGTAAAEVAAARTAQRVAEEHQAPPGHKVIVVPDELAEALEKLVRLYMAKP